MELHIAFCCDDNYLIPACIMLESLMDSNPDTSFTAHTFQDDLSEASIQKFRDLLEERGSRLVVHALPDHALELVSQAPTLKHISVATYYRLFLPYVIDPAVEDVLYLDCDILVRRSVRPLFSKSGRNTIIVGAPDINEEDHADRIGVDKYVNTGVLVMNMPGIRKMFTIESMLEAIAEIMKQPEKIVLGDQDIINLLFAGHIEEVPIIFNFQLLIHKAYCLKRPGLMKRIVIAHFITGDKPWKNEYLVVFAREYYSYLRKYLNLKQRIAWWTGKPQGVINMFERHKIWRELEKEQKTSA